MSDLPTQPLHPLDEAQRVVAGHAYVRGDRADTAGVVTDLLFNERVQVVAEDGGWCAIVTENDAYSGWIERAALGPEVAGDGQRRLCDAFASSARSEPSAPDERWMSYGTAIQVTDEAERPDGTWLRDAGGLWFPGRDFVTAKPMMNFVEEAFKFRGLRYVWGGRSSDGIDCSALIQLTLFICGRYIPRDTKDQRGFFGPGFAVEDVSQLRYGDLLYWPGHVAIHVADGIGFHADGIAMHVHDEPVEAIAANRGHSLQSALVQRIL